MTTHQLNLFAAPVAPVQSALVSALGFRCLGMVLPRDFHAVSAPVQIVERALCLPASAARLSVCGSRWQTESPSACACSGGVWLWAFQNPSTAQGEPWPLCSAHEALTCRCQQCQRPISPYAPLCQRCVQLEYEEPTVWTTP
jgi:hypothetical protein